MDRADALINAFAAHFGRRPSAIACAPGRVNLIGEHTDYNGLPVLPMAIDRNVLVAGAPRDDRRVRLANVDAAFGARQYVLEAQIPPFDGGDWGNYHKAATQGLLALLGASALHGGDFLVAGNVPAAAGLSSSSALLVGSALGLLAVNECVLPPATLAEPLAAAERYVGTLSGGMDQAVCLLGRAGHALRIDFDPLRTRAVRLPPGCTFVVCDSLVRAEKSGAARAAYNQRVAECRRACDVMAARVLPAGTARPAHLGALLRLVPQLDAAALIDALAAAAAPRTIVQRARHVLSEAARVERAAHALAAGEWVTCADLLNASHASCRDDYEISCAELEELVAGARAAGALAARLTGAGFGGCTVNLVRDAEVPRFLSLIDLQYYQPRGAIGVEHSWVFTASAGASVLEL
jgi:galactokinase